MKTKSSITMKNRTVRSLSSSCRTLSLLTAVTTLLACEGQQALESDGASLLRLLVVPSPGETGSSTTTQAVCEAGTDANDAAQALVDELNAQIADDRALLEAALGADGRTEGAITRYEASVDGRTMEIEVVTDGDAEVITGKIDGEDVLSGATVDERETGTLEYDGLAVAWETSEDGRVRAARNYGDSSASVDIETDRVRIVVDGTQGSRVAGWTADHGVYIGEDELPLCWEGSEACDVTCTAELVDELEADLTDE